MDVTESQDEFSLVSVPETNRYEIHDGEAVVGYAEYLLTPDQVVFTHTVVKKEYRGRGLAERLARFALDDAATTGNRIVPVCSYIAAFVRKNHDWDEHLEPSGSAPVYSSSDPHTGEHVVDDVRGPDDRLEQADDHSPE